MEVSWPRAERAKASLLRAEPPGIGDLRRNPAPQVLFFLVVLTGAVVVAASDIGLMQPEFLVSFGFVLTGTLAALGAARFPRSDAGTVWLAAIPLIDLVVWAFLRDVFVRSFTPSAFGLMFPLAWLAFAFPARLLFVAAVAITYAGAHPLIRQGYVDLDGLTGAVAFPAFMMAFAIAIAVFSRRFWKTERGLGNAADRVRGLTTKNSRTASTLAAVLDSTSEGIVIFDADGRPVSVNDAARQLHLVLADQPSGNGTPSARPADGSSVSFGPGFTARMRAGEFSEGVTARFIDADRERVMRFSAREIQDGNDHQIMGHVLISHDVTELVEAIDSRDRFLRTVGHELRTPLTVILGRAELLSELPEATESAHSIIRAGEKQLAVIKQLLAAGRQHVPDNLTAVQLEPTVRKAIEIFLRSPHGRKRCVHLESTNAQLKAWADPTDVERIVSILLSNAAQYSSDTSTITVALSQRSEHAVIDVIDKGVGMSSAERVRVFEPFYRTDFSHSQAVPGVGLGLTLAREIASSNSGSLELHAGANGVGTCARVALVCPE
ncbi:PAS domain-containing sensor histidine kinase [Microbacterium sp. cx-55]|uniref:sensor histidine kinase n=1 Tax=Microbacterium sp. cx-55 TaxID=2875948 RepID=UPI001CC11E7E|nr:PAS domain-containing sensor histidine kinase [Microbacterium sp. cx-55]MBZ4486725.1 PAS domain-containing sensor histidine kinase [Microbacterium sp. cx-55]UGB36316.1 PAS domain-containing sensor histidine kinase [Microbacterium sp. cx-55]